MQDFEKAKEARLEEEIFRELERDFDLKKRKQNRKRIKGFRKHRPRNWRMEP